MKQTGENVMLFAKQVELGDTAETIRAKNLLLAMDANKASALRLTAFYNDLIDTVTDAGDPRQTGLFAMSEPKLDDIIEVAMRGGNYGEYIETELEEVKQESDRPTELESRSRERVAEAPVTPVAQAKTEPKVELVQKEAEPKKERIKTTNPDGTYNLDNLREALRRLKLATSNATNQGQRKRMQQRQEEYVNLIAYVKENPNYKKPDMKAILEEQRKFNKEYAERGTEPQVAQEKAKAETKKTYEETVAEVSQAQDTTGRTGIVAPGFAPAGQPVAVPVQRITDYQGPANQQVRDSFNASKRPIEKHDLSAIQKVAGFIQRNFLRSSVPEVGYEQGQVRSEVVKIRKRWGITATLTWEEIKGIYNPLGKTYKQQMDWAVFLPDLVEDINLGKYDNQDLPFDFTSKQEVIDANTEIQALVSDPMDSTVANAIERRKAIFEANIQAVNDAANDIGVDFSGYFSRQDYIHHAVIEYMDQVMANPELKRTVTKTKYATSRISSTPLLMDL
jgi:chemotaxis protein histidine kinase CheA